MIPSALIEIGTEELPVGTLDVFYAQAPANLRSILTRYRLEFKSLRIEATSRRLAFFIEELNPKQREDKTTLLGPAHEKAYDTEGKPTPALEGFLKSRAASLRDIQIKETPRGRYVAVEKIEKGEATAKILPRLGPELLSSFSFPKMMRWEPSGFRFPRPIRWIAALYGRNVIPFSVAGVKAGRLTRGHRFISDRAIPLKAADWKDYEKRLRSGHVILSREAREKMIARDLKKKFHQKYFDSNLVRETAHLVEEPFLFQAKFSGTYRDLPEEVLATCMKKYQKIFACRDPKGNLLNRFVAVLNGRRSGLDQIQHDYENVLESRLRDAQYFYEEDTKQPLEKKVLRLKELVFLGRLGTVEDRVKRLQELASDAAHLSGHPDWEGNLKRVALLSKTDLVSHMVGEFPELQGVMGREFAEEAGEPSEIVRAIGEQYLPKNLAEDYETVRKKLSPLGALFGIIDRLDLLVGAFGIHLGPTGSEDPYALRRAGGVLVKLVRSFSFRFPLGKLIEKSYDAFQVKLDLSRDEAVSRLKEFLKDRVVFELQAKGGTRPYEILQGVMKSSFDDLTDVFERTEILSGLFARNPKVFFKTSKVIERTSNILKGVKESLNSVDPGLFQEPLEKKLFELLREKGPALEGSLEKKDYETVTRLYGETFFDPLHEFFDGVMVNVEDAPLRRNRQALMKQINALYTEKVADLSLLTEVRESS